MPVFAFDQMPLFLLGLAAVLFLGVEAWRRASARAAAHLAEIEVLRARIESAARREMGNRRTRGAPRRSLARAGRRHHPQGSAGAPHLRQRRLLRHFRQEPRRGDRPPLSARRSRRRCAAHAGELRRSRDAAPPHPLRRACGDHARPPLDRLGRIRDPRRRRQARRDPVGRPRRHRSQAGGGKARRGLARGQGSQSREKPLSRRDEP